MRAMIAALVLTLCGCVSAEDRAREQAARDAELAMSRADGSAREAAAKEEEAARLKAKRLAYIERNRDRLAPGVAEGILKGEIVDGMGANDMRMVIDERMILHVSKTTTTTGTTEQWSIGVPGELLPRAYIHFVNDKLVAFTKNENRR